MSRAQRGRVFRRQPSGTYYVQWYVNGKQFVRALKDEAGRPITREAAARKAAEKLLRPFTAGDAEAIRREAVAALQTAEEATAMAREAARPKLPLRDVWTKHPYTVNTRGTVERQLSASSVKDFRALWERFTRWAEGQGILHIEDVTTGHVEAFRRHLAASPISADRVNKVCLTCRVMFRAAGIAPNPFDGLRKLAHKANGRRDLTEAELKAVCGSATGELRPLYALGLYCGFRLGDACQLDWHEILPDLSKIIRQPSKTSYKGTELVIPVHPVLAAVLAETPPEQRKGPVVPGLCAEYQHDSAVVVRRIGRHFEGCGIRLHREGTGGDTGKRAVVEVGYHSLRHSFVSMSARQGVPLHVIQALCGHSTPAIQRLYLHHTTEDTRLAIGALPDVLSASEGHPPATPKEQLMVLVSGMDDAEAERALALVLQTAKA